MKTLLEWAVGELITPHQLRNNQVISEINHTGSKSVELLFVDKDRPEQGAVELLQVQVSSKPQVGDVTLPAYTCRVYTLMASTQPTNNPRPQNGEMVFIFTSTQQVIDWLQPK